MSIDRDSPLPLYYQLRRILLAKIESNELKPGDILPTEQQIQDEYGISRTTVRQALAELEDEGKVTRHRGRGTFVAKPKVQHSADEYPNLADHMAQQGITPGWIVLSAGWVTPTEEAARRLRVSPDEKVFRLERLRLENDEPIGHQVAVVAAQFAAAIDESAFDRGGSLRYLRDLSGLHESLSDRTLEAVEADESLAGHLNIAPGAALLKISRIVFSTDNVPIEAFVGKYRGDRFQYHINNMRAIAWINA